MHNRLSVEEQDKLNETMRNCWRYKIVIGTILTIVVMVVLISTY